MPVGASSRFPRGEQVEQYRIVGLVLLRRGAANRSARDDALGCPFDQALAIGTVSE